MNTSLIARWTRVADLAIVAGTLAGAAVASEPVPVPTFSPEFPVPDGPVWTTVATNDAIYVAGAARWGPMLGVFAVADAASGEVDTSLPIITGEVWSVVPDGHGGWFAGGEIYTIGGGFDTRIVHYLPDGSLDDWDPTVAGVVQTIVLSGPTLYVGGEFSAAAGAPRENLAAFDVASGDLLEWAPAVDGFVNTLAVSGGTVFIGGWFDAVNETPRDNLASVDAVTGDLLEWDPSATGGSVVEILIAGETMYAGGVFQWIGDMQRMRLAAFDLSTGDLLDWDPGADNSVLAFALSGSTLYTGGRFTTIGGESRACLAALDAATGDVLPWNPTAEGNDGTATAVHTLGVVGSDVLAGGSFTSIAGEPRRHLAIIDGSTGIPTAWIADAAGPHATYVLSVAVHADRIAAGGNFHSLGVTHRSSGAALDPATGAILPWDPPIDEVVDGEDYDIAALLASDSTIFIGGHFGNDSHPHPLLVAVDADTGALIPEFTPIAESLGDQEGRVACLEVLDQILYVSCTIEGVFGLRTLNSETGEVDPAWLLQTNGSIGELHLRGDGEILYFGGNFSQPRNHAGSLTTADGLLTIWNPDVNDTVNSLVSSSPFVYLGGKFTALSDEIRWRLAKVDNMVGIPFDWDPKVDGPPGVWVQGLVKVGDLIIAGGRFSSVNEVPRRNLVAISDDTEAITSWDPRPDSEVWTICANDSVLVVGGEFDETNDLPRPYLAVFELDDSGDCNHNGIPDNYEVEHELSPDCNANGTPDWCDIYVYETSEDSNGNEIPDECECPADFDGDWDVDTADLLVLLGHWGEDGSNGGDVDFDGDVDTVDLLALLAAWGECP